MAPRTGSPEQYAEEMGELWTGLTRTLGGLDRIAAEPDRLDHDGSLEALRRLQYRLHLASEQASEVEPPTGAETAHAELAAALCAARDATGEVAEAVGEQGLEGLVPLLHEWRGALFRVRLARLRLATPAPRRPRAVPEPATEGLARPAIAFVLALVGALAFAAGATLGLWPLWAGGLVAVCGSVVAYRP
ncbi:MAG TPA: hypothetical protein VHC67_17130 [Gaiellaceae bacterium]|nr:hypothetical protein [Gaiellaceae bacterium]